MEKRAHLISNEPMQACDVNENVWGHFIQSIVFTSSITFGLNQPLPQRGVGMDAGARLQRIKGFTWKKLH